MSGRLGLQRLGVPPQLGLPGYYPRRGAIHVAGQVVSGSGAINGQVMLRGLLEF